MSTSFHVESILHRNPPLAHGAVAMPLKRTMACVIPTMAFGDSSEVEVDSNMSATASVGVLDMELPELSVHDGPLEFPKLRLLDRSNLKLRMIWDK